MNDLLNARNGKVIRPKDVADRDQHMNILKRCHFQLTGGAKFDLLISRIIEYVDCIFKMCSEAQAEVMSLCRTSEALQI